MIRVTCVSTRARGRYIGFSVYRYGLGTSEVSFMRFGADLRTYIPLGASFTLAGRVTGSIVAGGTVPTYARQYFGYGERIRGYFKTVLEGENLLGSSVELRYALLPLRVFRMPGTFLPDEFTVWQFGISLALFADAGTTWFRHEPSPLAICFPDTAAVSVSCCRTASLREPNMRSTIRGKDSSSLTSDRPSDPDNAGNLLHGLEYFYAPPSAIAAGVIRIDGDEFAHLSHVMRRTPGDIIGISDGQGTAYTAEITSVEKRMAICSHPFHTPDAA